SFRFDGKVKPSRKTHCPHQPQPVFAEPLVRLADRANDTDAQVLLPADEIQHFPGLRAHEQPVDREVAPLHILAWRLGVYHTVRMTPIGIAGIRSECRDFDLAIFAPHLNHTELCADRYAVRE